MTGHDPLCRYEVDGLGPVGWCDCDLIAKVRADERGKWLAYDDVLARDAWADLRAQVEALREKWLTRDWDYYAALDDVLDLIDGSGDG